MKDFLEKNLNDAPMLGAFVNQSDEIKVEVLNSVEPKYNETLAKMQKFFTDDYDKTIKDNTIDSKTLKKLTIKRSCSLVLIILRL